MCWCTPTLRTPFCGAADCHPPGEPNGFADLFAPQSDACRHDNLDVARRLLDIGETGARILEIRLRWKPTSVWEYDPNQPVANSAE